MRVLRRTSWLFWCGLVALWILPIQAPFVSFISAVSAASGNGVYHGVLARDLGSWDPAIVEDPVSLQVVGTVHEALYQYPYLGERSQPEPLLAADQPWVSKDGLTVRIPIRPDVRFSSGEPVKAEHFVLALKRVADPTLGSPYWWRLRGRIAGLDEFRANLVRAGSIAESRTMLERLPVAGLRARDDLTIELQLRRPQPRLTQLLALSFTAPVSTATLKSANPIGTGPFILKEWQRGGKIALDRNPGYHPAFYPTEGSLEFRAKGLLADAGKTLPFVDRIEFEILPEARARYQKFIQSDADAIELPRELLSTAVSGGSSLSPELASRGIRLGIGPADRIFFIGFNMKDPLLGRNRLLRQALSSAVDRAEWSEALADASASETAAGVVFPAAVAMEGWNFKGARFPHDPKAARALLAKAGFPGGKGLPELRLDMRSADRSARRLGAFFESALSRIGVRLRVTYQELPAFLARVRRGDTQIYYGGWKLDSPDPEDLLQLLHGPNGAPGPNESSFQDPKFDRMFEELAQLPAGDHRRAQLVSKMDAIVQEEVPWVLGYSERVYFLVQPWVMNFRALSYATTGFKYLRINSSSKARYRETSGVKSQTR